MILPYILNTICWINVTPGILVPCDPVNDHLLYLGHCDLYFMLFSVILPFIFITISWRIVIPGLLYLCDKMIYIQIHLGQCDLYYMA